MEYDRIFVDGHSVIFSWPELAKRHQRSPQNARDQLLSTLIQFQDAVHIPVTLVFDGGKRAKRSPEVETLDALELLYSEPGETADAVIERCVATRTSGSKVLVITNDRVERLTVEGLGGETMSVEGLTDWLQREEQQFGRRIEEIHKQARKYRKFP